MPAPLASDYALPAYAQTSPDDQVSFAMPTQVSTARFRFTADGAFVYVIVAVSVVIQTSAAAGSRTWGLDIMDPNLTSLVQVPGAALIPAATQIVLSHLPAQTTAFAVGANWLLPLAVIPLQPGMVLQASLFGKDAADVFPAPTVTALRYSTAPQPVVRALTLAAAPLVA